VIPLVAYLAWIFVSLGALPRTGTHSFATVHAEGGTVGAFLGQIEPVIGSSLVPNLFYIFSTVVLVTSYLTVSLALTDILSASIKRIGRWRPSGLARRLMLGAVCFLPPFAVVVVYPDGFVPLLGVASIFCIIICMVFPAEALRRITRRGAAQRYGLRPPTYRVMWGWAGFVLVMASSAAILALQILNMADALPQ
jgi:tyrosine-specific transport protein